MSKSTISPMVGPIVLYLVGLAGVLAAGIGGIFTIQNNRSSYNLGFGITGLIAALLLGGAWVYAIEEGKKAKGMKKMPATYIGPTALYSVGAALVLGSSIAILVGARTRNPGMYNYAAIPMLIGGTLAAGGWYWASKESQKMM